ncbi:hypothetical protein L2E82_50328 [Cichorium intybus]|nr:hypothetical protein L2E82_50328 [Cichorium intybus]
MYSSQTISATLDVEIKVGLQYGNQCFAKFTASMNANSCGDIETIPPSLLKALAIIRKSVKGDYKVDEEVECILSVSCYEASFVGRDSGT